MLNKFKIYKSNQCKTTLCSNRVFCTIVQLFVLVLLFSMSLNSQSYEEKYAVEIYINSNPTSSTDDLIIKSPSTLSGSHTITLPSSVGTNGQILMTDGTNSTTWNTETSTASAQGVDKAVQFNDGGDMGGSASFTWDNSGTYLSIAVSSSSYTLENYDVMRTGRDGQDGQLLITSGTYNIYFLPNSSMTETSIYAFPPDDGPSYKGLQTDGSGNMYWSGTVNFGPTGEGDLNDNTETVDNGYIGGGDDNNISGGADNSSMGGGHDNNISGSASNSGMVGGNENNISGSASNSTVMGSDGSNISGSASNSGIIGGDNGNISGSASNSSIFGGLDANISGSTSNSSIFGGDGNSVEGSANSSIITGGLDNSVESGAIRSGIISGINNTLNSSSQDSFIGGGNGNIQKSTDGAIVGGLDNTINSTANRSMIGGGSTNTLSSDDSAIIGGLSSNINSSEDKITIMGGTGTTSGSGDVGFIGGGGNNDIGNSDYGALMAGNDNQLNSDGDRSFIAGGDDQIISDVDVAIFAGRENEIKNNADGSVVLGGRQADMQDANSVMLGGYQNVIKNSNGNCGIVAGRGNEIQSQNSTMMFGRDGDFTSNSHYSLGGGYGVTIQNNSYQFAMGRDVTAQGTGTWVFADGNNNADISENTANSWSCRFASGYRFFTNTALSNGIMADGGDSDWTQISDSNRKEYILRMDPMIVIQKIKELKISSWSYKNIKEDMKKENKKRNYGPMAQNFYSLFGKDKYGSFSTEETLKGHDLSSIFMLGVQGMKLKIEQHNAEIKRVKVKSEKIGDEISNVASKIDSIEDKLNKINDVKSNSNIKTNSKINVENKIKK